MFETIRNAWKVAEIRKKLLFTLLIIIIFRFGSALTVPFLELSKVQSWMDQNATGGNFLEYLNVLTGGALSKATIFSLSITPYINASIIMQLLTYAIPPLERLQSEGEEGRKRINQITAIVSLGLSIFMSIAYYFTLKNMGAVEYTEGFQGVFAAVVISACFVAGAMLVVWMGNRINDKGIGNGISLIIMIGIVARLPHALLAEVNARFQTASGSAIMLILELVLLFLVFMATIALVQAVRKVPVQYAKRIVGNKQYGGVRQYIPLKMNAANVMPIIFAQALMFIPALFSGTAFAAAFSSMTGFWYNFTLAVLVIAFTYFYTAIIINPQMMADDMKRNGGFIPGVKPGKQTVNYIDTIMTRITLPGSFFLAIVAILPALAMKFLGIQQSFAYFYGGTSLLIMVGVVLDTLKQIESYLLMRHYDGLMKTGRIQGRH